MGITKSKAKRFKFLNGKLEFGTYTPLMPREMFESLEKIVFFNMPDTTIHIALGNLTFIDPYLTAFIESSQLIKILEQEFKEKILVIKSGEKIMEYY